MKNKEQLEWLDLSKYNLTLKIKLNGYDENQNLKKEIVIFNNNFMISNLNHNQYIKNLQKMGFTFENNDFTASIDFNKFNLKNLKQIFPLAQTYYINSIQDIFYQDTKNIIAHVQNNVEIENDVENNEIENNVVENNLIEDNLENNIIEDNENNIKIENVENNLENNVKIENIANIIENKNNKNIENSDIKKVETLNNNIENNIQSNIKDNIKVENNKEIKENVKIEEKNVKVEEKINKKENISYDLFGNINLNNKEQKTKNNSKEINKNKINGINNNKNNTNKSKKLKQNINFNFNDLFNIQNLPQSQIISKNTSQLKSTENNKTKENISTNKIKENISLKNDLFSQNLNSNKENNIELKTTNILENDIKVENNLNIQNENVKNIAINKNLENNIINEKVENIVINDNLDKINNLHKVNNFKLVEVNNLDFQLKEKEHLFNIFGTNFNKVDIFIEFDNNQLNKNKILFTNADNLEVYYNSQLDTRLIKLFKNKNLFLSEELYSYYFQENSQNIKFLYFTNSNDLEKFANIFIENNLNYSGNNTLFFNKFVNTIYNENVENSDIRKHKLQEAVEKANFYYFHKHSNLKLNKANYDLSIKLLEKQPTQKVLTADTYNFQQFSTPLPLSVMAQILLSPKENSKVLEPTIGNGSLISLLPNDTKIFGVEIDENRYELVKNFRENLKVENKDFLKSSTLSNDFDYTIANPPFGSNNGQKFINNLKVNRIDYEIVLNTLALRKDKGRSVFILGGDYSNLKLGEEGKGKIAGGSEYFFNWINANYELLSLVEIDGKLYSKQGAKYPVRLLVVGNKLPENEIKHRMSRAREIMYSAKNNYSMPYIDNWNSLYEYSKNIIEKNYPEDEKERILNNLDDKENTLQVSYKPFNNISMEQVETLIPKNTVAPLNDAFSSLIKKYGNVEDLVSKELDYTKDELIDYFSPEQLDAIYLAICGIKENHAIINGDATGLGKGRVAAAMIRYAVLNGIHPVFITEKANLFSDIWRDLKDINSTNIVEKPFILNADNSNIQEIVNDKINIICKHNKNDLNKLIKENMHPSQLNYAWTALTYSQIQGKANIDNKYIKIQELENSDNPNDQLEAQILKENMFSTSLINIGNKNEKSEKLENKKLNWFLDTFTDSKNTNFFILDESHNAAGINNDKPSNTNKNLREILNYKNNLSYFSSATSIKRIEQMPLYINCFPINQRTNIRKILDTVKNGDIGLSEIFSTLLIKNGSYIRRGHDLSKVEYHTILNNEKLNFYKNFFNDFSIVLTNLSYLSGELGDNAREYVKDLNENLVQRDEKDKKFNLVQTSFGSNLFQISNQIRACVIAEDTAYQAIEEIKKGRSPAIFVDITQENMLLNSIKKPRLQPIDDAIIDTWDFNELNAKNLDYLISQREINNLKENLEEQEFRDLYKSLCHIYQRINMNKDYYMLILQDDENNENQNNQNNLNQNSNNLFNNNSSEKIIENNNENLTLNQILNKREKLLENENQINKDILDLSLNTFFDRFISKLEFFKIKQSGIGESKIYNIMTLLLSKEEGINSFNSRLIADKIKNWDKNILKLNDRINNLNKKYPNILCSPCDIVKGILKENGYSVSELTGRQFAFNKIENNNSIYTVEKIQKRSRNDIISDFNNGKTDVILFSTAGATGISMHSSPKFSNQKRRSLLLMTLPYNVSTLLQVLGRVNRKGQTSYPIISTMAMGIPFERRIIQSNNRKLKEMNANTESNRENETENKDFIDVFNKVGDYIAFQFLKENPDIVDILRIDMPEEKPNEDEPKNKKEKVVAPNFYINKIYQCLILFDTEKQEKIINELDTNFTNMMNVFLSQGENPLKTKELGNNKIIDTKILSVDGIYQKINNQISIENNENLIVDGELISKNIENINSQNNDLENKNNNIENNNLINVLQEPIKHISILEEKNNNPVTEDILLKKFQVFFTKLNNNPQFIASNKGFDNLSQKEKMTNFINYIKELFEDKLKERYYGSKTLKNKYPTYEDALNTVEANIINKTQEQIKFLTDFLSSDFFSQENNYKELNKLSEENIFPIRYKYTNNESNLLNNIDISNEVAGIITGIEIPKEKDLTSFYSWKVNYVIPGENREQTVAITQLIKKPDLEFDFNVKYDSLPYDLLDKIKNVKIGKTFEERQILAGNIISALNLLETAKIKSKIVLWNDENANKQFGLLLPKNVKNQIEFNTFKLEKEELIEFINNLQQQKDPIYTKWLNSIHNDMQFDTSSILDKKGNLILRLRNNFDNEVQFNLKLNGGKKDNKIWLDDYILNEKILGDECKFVGDRSALYTKINFNQAQKVINYLYNMEHALYTNKETFNFIKGIEKPKNEIEKKSNYNYD